MQISGLPTRMPIPFADSGTKNSIPQASQIGITAGLASYTTGFPPLTMVPVVAGGVPPYGADFNGILNAITQSVRWMNAGGAYAYDSTFATTVSGYPKGALIAKVGYDGFWQNTVDGNTSNPDSGGAGWASFTAHGLTRYSASGTFTAPVAGTYYLSGCAAGGGGGGGGGAAGAGRVGSGGGGGGAGQSVIRVAVTLTLGQVVAVTIGAGGVGGGADSGGNAANGGVGGNVTFGSLLTLPGGAGGIGGVNAATGACPGSAGGSGYPTGGIGMDSTSGNASASGGMGGGSAYGAGGVPGRGGSASGGTTAPVMAGFGGGGGGGGGSYQAASGVGGGGATGAAGILIVEW